MIDVFWRHPRASLAWPGGPLLTFCPGGNRAKRPTR